MERVNEAKKISKNYKIKIIENSNYCDDKYTINNLIKLIRNYRSKNFIFLMGADNLISFHKWHKWKDISKKCVIIVFDRHGYKRKSLNSTTFKRLNKDKLKFFEFKKVNISSSQLRKI